jgi:hypothetical protein
MDTVERPTPQHHSAAVTRATTPRACLLLHHARPPGRPVVLVLPVLHHERVLHHEGVEHHAAAAVL